MPTDLHILDRPLHGRVGAGTASDPRLVVEIWLVVPREGGHCLLMCRRSEHRGGFWQGVSGRVEPGDETLRRAACRELDEELGVRDVGELIDLGHWTEFRSLVTETRYRKRSLALVLEPGTSPDPIRLSHEHDACRLMTFDEARSVARFPEYLRELDQIERLLGR